MAATDRPDKLIYFTNNRPVWVYKADIERALQLPSDRKLFNQLTRPADFRSGPEKRVLEVLEEFRRSTHVSRFPARVWISDSLKRDLGLTEHQPSRPVLQVLYLGEGTPPFILTLPDDKDSGPYRALTRNCGSALRRNSYSVPKLTPSSFGRTLFCVLNLKDLTSESLHEQLDLSDQMMWLKNETSFRCNCRNNTISLMLASGVVESYPA